LALYLLGQSARLKDKRTAPAVLPGVSTDRNAVSQQSRGSDFNRRESLKVDQNSAGIDGTRRPDQADHH
jgi:hypothetical protein